MSREEHEWLRILVRHFNENQPLSWQDWMERFLEDLASHHGNVSMAIDLCPVSRDTVYKYRRRNQQFAQRWAAITGPARGEAKAARRRLALLADQAEPHPGARSQKLTQSEEDHASSMSMIGGIDATEDHGSLHGCPDPQAQVEGGQEKTVPRGTAAQRDLVPGSPLEPAV